MTRVLIVDWFLARFSFAVTRFHSTDLSVRSVSVVCGSHFHSAVAVVAVAHSSRAAQRRCDRMAVPDA